MAHNPESSSSSSIGNGTADNKPYLNEAAFAYLSLPPALAQVEVKYNDGSSETLLFELPGFDITVGGVFPLPDSLSPTMSPNFYEMFLRDVGQTTPSASFGPIPVRRGVENLRPVVVRNIEILLGTYLRCPARGTYSWTGKPQDMPSAPFPSQENSHGEPELSTHVARGLAILLRQRSLSSANIPRKIELHASRMIALSQEFSPVRRCIRSGIPHCPVRSLTTGLKIMSALRRSVDEVLFSSSQVPVNCTLRCYVLYSIFQELTRCWSRGTLSWMLDQGRSCFNIRAQCSTTGQNIFAYRLF